MDWITEVSFLRKDTAELDSAATVKEVLDQLECYAPIFLRRGSDRYAVCLYVEADRLSEATDRAESLVKLAFRDCGLAWPATRRTIADIYIEEPAARDRYPSF